MDGICLRCAFIIGDEETAVEEIGLMLIDVKDDVR